MAIIILIAMALAIACVVLLSSNASLKDGLKQEAAKAEASREQAKAELEAERKKNAEELERLRSDTRARLGEVESQLTLERGQLREEETRIRQHYEAEARKVVEALAPLRKYERVENAEAEAQRMLSEAVETASKLKLESERYSEQLKSTLLVEQRELEDKLRSLRTQAGRVLADANVQARGIVQDAHTRAEQIGGSAYVALREKDALEQAVKAIRNVVEGYGDRYVVPTHSVLDGLASDYGHTEAGEALRVAREQSRRMVEEGHAAECDYAEAKRKETAVRFVVDAFNGRVDAILARSRHDNLGTLQQEIRDAFALVNLNGEAFRNARILPAYLDSRLTELKWAVAAQELRQKEREEQRRIQEQIREEEKRRKEIERALREAAKDEEVLKTALERAKKEAAAATLEEKAKFEARLEELSKRLAEAEAKGQRAQSLAQQTRAGHVYVISNVGSFGEDVFKIGMTRRLEPMDRVRELGDASVPFVFDVHAIIYTADAPALERELHERFDEFRINRVNYRKEFFRLPIGNLREYVGEKGLQASFTMAAEAREYRESLALAAMSKEEAAKYREGLMTTEPVDAEA
jgi:hypothetical protein